MDLKMLMLAPLVQQFMSANPSQRQQLVSYAIPLIIGLIQTHPGGLMGLIQQFEGSGLGPQVQSWLGSGQNAPITAEQIQQAITPQQIQQLANLTGVQHPQIANLLAAYLPQVMNHLTLNGTAPVPSAAEATQHLAAVQSAVASADPNAAAPATAQKATG